MDLVKDIFFFIGSVLGILAFLHTLIEPAFSDNRQKWEALKERLTEQDLINLQHQVYLNRRISDELLYRVLGVCRDINEDAEYLRFGPPFRGLFEEHKNELSSDCQSLVDHVQVPYWRHNFFEHRDERRGEWDFDKSYFLDELPTVAKKRNPESPRLDPYRAYEDHLNEASDAVDRMRMHYRAIGILANLHTFEVLLARRIVKERSKLPESR